jgi:SRSO17 transposase
MMGPRELEAPRKNLDEFLTRFDDCMQTQPCRDHLRTYTGGQVSNLPRKSIEPMALEAQVPPRSLQEFLSLHKWDHESARLRVQEIVIRENGSPDAIALIDETSHPKKGDDTVGVQHQYCGATGKTDNCVVTVHLGYATESFQALVDGDIFLSEAWAGDAVRRHKAGVPSHVTYRPKWRIALDLLGRAIANGMPFKFLTADEGYGCSGEFRQGVADFGLQYVVEVPRKMSGWTSCPPMVGPGDYSGSGRQRVRVGLAPDAPPPRRVDALWPKREGPRWQTYHVKDTEKGPVVWKVRATRFFPWEANSAGEEGWLIIARNVLDGEVKYFFSNAPADTPLETLLRIAFSRWKIERLFEDGKGEIGLAHFEVRRYLPLMRHLILSMVSLLFLVKETDRLRGKKSLVVCDAGQRSAPCPA